MVSRVSYRCADAVVGNSVAGLKAYSVPKSKSHCIYNGFNDARFKAVDNIDFDKVKYDLDVKTKYLVSMFARVDHYKDYDSFVALSEEVRKIRDDVTFLAVGGGIDYEKYRDMYSNDSGLRFIGLRSDVEALMSVTDVSVLFSNYKFHKEGISNSILESMALGTPVIATNDGGSPEIITDAVNGYLVDDNNITQAARILSELLDNPELLIRLGRNARETVLGKFLLETMVRNYVSLYDDLLSRKMI
jgi:glycosyltransferase involved in cell wall biosynthesis